VVFNIISAETIPYDDSQIAVVSLDTGQIRILLDGGSHPRFVSTGHLVYVRAGSLIAVPFDPIRLEVTGPAQAVGDGVITDAFDGSVPMDVGGNGLLAYVRGVSDNSDNRVVWVDRQGRTEPLIDVHRPFSGLRLAPDGKRLAVSITGANDQVWVYDLSRRTLTPLTFAWDNAVDGWTPDGSRLVVRSARSGNWNFYWQRLDGGGALERLMESEKSQGSGSWSPDGQLFVFHELPGYYDVALGAGTGSTVAAHDSLSLMTVTFGRRTIRRLMDVPFSVREPALSPDGHWLAYVSYETGRPEVFVQPFPSLDSKWPISTEGGLHPVWHPNGHELFYQNGHSLMVVSLQMQPRFVAGAPHPLFEGAYLADGWHVFDVARDGRFIMIQTGQPKTPRPEIVLVQNWFEELKRRMPAR
jgi:serine/threonine-protein kinase